jgi:hypothetical protein
MFLKEQFAGTHEKPQSSVGSSEVRPLMSRPVR